MKKIETVSNIGITHAGDRSHAVIVSYQTEDDDVAIIRDLPGICVAYLEMGFLVDADDKWHFHDAEGKLVASALKADIGECTEVSVLGDHYVFDKTPELRTLNGGKLAPDVDVLCIDAKGQRLPYPTEKHICISRKDLFSADDYARQDDDLLDDEDDDCDEEATGWSERKKIYKRVLEDDGEPTDGLPPTTPDDRGDHL